MCSSRALSAMAQLPLRLDKFHGDVLTVVEHVLGERVLPGGLTIGAGESSVHLPPGGGR